MLNCVAITSNGKQPVRRKGENPLHFFDSNTLALSPTTSGQVVNLFGPAQGSTTSSRVGDTLFYDKMWLNYSVSQLNSDLISATRVIIFQWHPNSALLAPNVADIMQLAADNVYSFYDWQYSNQSIILYDRVHVQAGSATEAASSGNQGYFGEIDLSKARKRVEFDNGTVNGSNLIYLLITSDSNITPFPNVALKSRISFSID